MDIQLEDFNWDDTPIDPQVEVQTEENDEKTSTEETPEEVESDNDEEEPSEEESDVPEESEESEESIYTSVFKDFKEKNLFNHVDLEEGEDLTEDRFFELQQEEIEQEVKARLNAFAKEQLDPDAQAFIKFKMQGGDTAKFFEMLQGSSELELGDITDPDYQDEVIRYQLKKEGFDEEEIEDRLEMYEDSGKKEKFATKLYNRFIEDKEREKEYLLKQQEQEKEQAIKRAQEFKQAIDKVVEETEDINGLKLTNKDKSSLSDFLTKRDRRTNLTGFQTKLNETFQDKKKLVLLAKLLSDDFNFKAFEKSVITKKTKDIKTNIEKRANTKPKGSGSSPKSISEVADMFDSF